MRRVGKKRKGSIPAFYSWGMGIAANGLGIYAVPDFKTENKFLTRQQGMAYIPCWQQCFCRTNKF